MTQLDGRAIREIRKKLGVSQEELARAIGVSFATVNRWENGRTRPSRTAQKLLRDYLASLGHESISDEESTALRRKLRVLIVDDDEMVLRALKRTLERYPDVFDVETAADGYEAGVKTGTFRPDVVVLDIYLPGMNGFEVCRFLKSNPETASTKIIAVTGYGTEPTLRGIREAGADAVLLKPLETIDFLKTLQMVTGGRQGWQWGQENLDALPSTEAFTEEG